MQRLCIYPKDIMIITGRSDKYGRTLIKKIKEHLNKQQHQVVSVEEFCQYMGLQLETVVKQLR
jgi:ribose 5-phosphate isomerase RpiB